MGASLPDVRKSMAGKRPAAQTRASGPTCFNEYQRLKNPPTVSIPVGGVFCPEFTCCYFFSSTLLDSAAFTTLFFGVAALANPGLGFQ